MTTSEIIQSGNLFILVSASGNRIAWSKDRARVEQVAARNSECIEARMWDSERRDSPYSTVADPSDEDYCEGCDQLVDYSDGSKHGRCGCEGI